MHLKVILEKDQLERILAYHPQFQNLNDDFDDAGHNEKEFDPNSLKNKVTYRRNLSYLGDFQATGE